MKHGVHSQNQSIVLKKYQKLFKIPQNDKTDPSRWFFEAGLMPEPKSVSPNPKSDLKPKTGPKHPKSYLSFI